MSPEHPRVLLTGATGYLGGLLAPRLLATRCEVHCLTRKPPAARRLPDAIAVHTGDVVSGDGLDGALDGMDVAYYLIHSMGRGSGSHRDFAERDRRAAVNFGRAARQAGVQRVVYLGGLGPTGEEASEHLRSRHEVALLLADHVPQLVYLRAAMVLGAGSASFQMLRSLVDRLPAMICPRWVDTRSQPAAVADVLGALEAAGCRRDVPEEVQVGGAEVLTYREMMLRFARIAGHRAPLIVSVPVLTPRLSSYWVGLVTPVEAGLARPLVEGLSSETIVLRPPPPGFNDRPLGFDDAVRAALAP